MNGYRDLFNKSTLYMSYWYNERSYILNICNKEYITSYSSLFLNPEQYCKYTENEYCALFEMSINGGSNITFLIRKQMPMLYNYKENDLQKLCNAYKSDVEFYNVEYGQNNIIHCSHHTTLYNNYIWFTEIIIPNNTICFYAQNVITNVKYAVHKLIEISHSGNTICKFYNRV